MLDETKLQSQGGNIYIAGKRNAGNESGAGIINYSGSTGTLIDSGTGTITMIGEAEEVNSWADFGIMTGLHPTEYSGTFTIRSSNASAATAISLFGSSKSAEDGILIENRTRILSTATANGGGISISGSAASRNALSVGIGSNPGTLEVLSSSGTIDINVGTYPLLIANASNFRLGSIALDNDVPSSTANVLITSNNVNWTGNVPVRTTGTLTVTPTANNSFASAFNTSSLNYTGISGLTIGNSTNTSNITFGSATSIAGPITAYGGTIAVNAALTAATQTAAITANGLALNGPGTFTLENTANNIATIAGGSSAAKIGSLSFVDAAGGLEIGTVNPTGITSTGSIKIETLEGNITLSENLATDDITADAIILNAGKTAAIGTRTGGNIIVIGTPTLTYGSGGRAKLFSGDNINSTGLTTLVGCVGNTRVNVDETTATFSPVLANDISFALYRAEDIQAPTISNFNNISKTYFDGSFTVGLPISNSTGAFIFTSSNTAVATISGTTVTILGAGTSTITANQAAVVNYNPASITATLTVSSVSVLTNTGAISGTNLNYVNQYGQIGGDFGLSANGAILNAKTLPRDGFTAARAGVSAKQIKTDYPSSSDGVYWISNPNINAGAPFQIYADMTTDGGGWMVLNISGNSSPSSLSSSVTSLTDKRYLPRATVIELATLCTDVQLRSGNSAASYAHKTTSTDPLAIGALQSSATVLNGAGTWANGASSTFVVNSGSWCWTSAGPEASSGCIGWPIMYQSNSNGACVHWYVEGGVNTGRTYDTPNDAWFSTWIR